MAWDEYCCGFDDLRALWILWVIVLLFIIVVFIYWIFWVISRGQCASQGLLNNNHCQAWQTLNNNPSGLTDAEIDAELKNDPEAPVVLLSCVDYRIVEKANNFMRTQGYKDSYDLLISPGASLGPQQDEYPGWHGTFYEQLAVCKHLHQVNTVVITDHTDCGAFREFLGENDVDQERLANDPVYEAEIHQYYMDRLGRQIKEKYPDFIIKTHLLKVPKRFGGYD